MKKSIFFCLFCLFLFVGNAFAITPMSGNFSKNLIVPLSCPPLQVWLPTTLLIITILAVIVGLLLFFFNKKLRWRLKTNTHAVIDLDDKINFLITNLTIGYLEVNANDEIIVWNPAATKIFGFSESEALNKNIYQLLLHPENHSKVKDMKELYLENNKNGYLEVNNITKKGKTIDCEWFFTIQREKKNQPLHFILMVNDVTKKKRTRRDLEQLIEKMKQMMLDQDRFIASSMHDLKNYLAPITAYCELLNSDELSPEKSKEVLEKLNSSISTLTKTFIEMMNISKAKGELMTIEPREFNLRTLVETTVGMLDGSLYNKNITLQNEIAADQTLFADYDMSYSILTNLIGNAIKFTPENGKISIFGQKMEQNMFEISIRDTGMGVNEEKFKKMMTKNQYFSTAGTNGEKGTGLGLLLVKSLIANHGGDFKAVRNPEGGSTFSFTLPYAEVPKP